VTKDCDILDMDQDNILFLSNKEILDKIINEKDYKIIKHYMNDEFVIN
jgi:hypothetical protein